MPFPTTSAAKGYSMLGPELGTSLGMVQLLTDTPVSSLPVSLTNAIPGAATNGMRLLILAYNHTATGTITVTGTAPLSGAAVNETTTTFSLAEVPGDVVAYTTSTIFGAVNASGVTLGSGLTGGRIQIFGIQAATRLLPGDVKIHDKMKEYSPEEQRGSYERDFHLLPLAATPEWEWAGDFRPDTCLFLFEGGYNATLPQVSLPASPVAILTAGQSVTSSGNASATNQPTAPGMVVQVVLSGSPSSAGTVTISGTNLYGEAYSEVVVPSSKTAGTYTSLGVFASINANGIVWTAFGAGTIAINGYFGWNQGTTAGDTLQSFALEQYDSEGSFAAPYCVIDEWTIEGGADKECKATAKGPCQYVATVGNTATTTSQITPLVQSQDVPITGWRAVAWLDPYSGTAGSTPQQDVIDWKIACKLDLVPKFTSWGNPIPYRNWNRIYRKRRHVEGELTLDMTGASISEVQAWKQRRKRQIRLRLLALPAIDGASNDNLGFDLDLAVRYVDSIERDFTTGKESVELKLKIVGEYDLGFGYSHKFTRWITRFFSF